jgi:hypothetical protein
MKRSLEYTRVIEIRNNTGAVLNDVRLIVGGDTQFAGSDNGYADRSTRYGGSAVYTYTGVVPGSMIFSGTAEAPADRYFAGHFNLGRIMAKEEAWLSNEASGSGELVDVGYYLQWGDGARTISAGGVWSVGMSEAIANTALTSTVHTIDNDYILTVRDETLHATLKAQFDHDPNDLKLFRSDGATEVTDGHVGTGMVLRLVIGSEVIDGKTVVVLGDLDGNGKIDTFDASLASRHFLGINTLTGPHFKAADLFGTGVVDTFNALMIVRHFLGLMSLFE